MKIKPVADFSPSLIWRLRYIEWLFIAVHLIMAITAGSDKLLFNLAVYGVFIVSSWIIPVNRPLKFRQSYILLAMVAIVWANFLNVSLDLLLYLYLAKSFFLLGGRSIIYITVLSGVGWVASECFSEIREFQELSVGFKPPFGFGNYNLSTIFVFSLGLYVAISIFTIFLSSVIVAEYKSRKRAEALAEQVEILAKNLERTRIARDIHDSLGHTLTNLDIQLKVAQKLRDRDPERAFQAIDTAIMLSSQCIEDVSHAVQTMRRDNFDLDRALNNLIEQVRSDRTIEIQWNINLPQLSLATSHQIYCLVKEGLINIQKHANASQVSFQGYSTGRQIILKLEDNGIGFDRQRVDSGSPLNQGFGLKGMMERVQILRGRLDIDSTPGKGTRILVTIPQ
ncbi:sensor histidine kinase [Pleurocapsales cyanobacterium LEGE 10410]|nr:sensor histidine kinase [Pleurocapsales cyanobacterium LEGE 10410]